MTKGYIGVFKDTKPGDMLEDFFSWTRPNRVIICSRVYFCTSSENEQSIKFYVLGGQFGRLVHSPQPSSSCLI